MTSFVLPHPWLILAPSQIRSWSLQSNPLGVLEEREGLYNLLSQTTDENMNKNYKNYTLDPRTRLIMQLSILYIISFLTMEY